VTNFRLQLHDQRKGTQGQVDNLQHHIDDLNTDLEQQKLRETGLEQEVLQVTEDYLAEIQRRRSYYALVQDLAQQFGQEIRQANTNLRLKARQLKDEQLINDRQLHQIRHLELERQQQKDDKLAEVQQLIDQHGAMDNSMHQLIQQNAMDKDDHQTALERQMELLDEAANKLSVEKAARLQESEDHIKEKEHYLVSNRLVFRSNMY
jgi:flagellar biosynthesis chaperone FliJ